MTIVGTRLRRHLVLAMILTASSACAAARVPPASLPHLFPQSFPQSFPMSPQGSADEPLVCVGPYVGSALACAQVVEDDDPPIPRRNPA